MDVVSNATARNPMNFYRTFLQDIIELLDELILSVNCEIEYDIWASGIYNQVIAFFL